MEEIVIDDIRFDLIPKIQEYENKIIKLEEEYKKKNPNYSEKKLKDYINRKMQKETDNLIALNVNPALEMLNS